MVSDVPPSNDDQGGSTQEDSRAPSSEPTGDQGLDDRSGETQGRESTPTPGDMVEEATEHHEPELLRLRVRVSDPKTHRVKYVWIPINTLI